MNIVIICGGRDFTDAKYMEDMLFPYDIDFVINGGAPGADRLAREWAERLGIPCATVYAQWKFYRASAGPIRNRWMLDLNPTQVFAFPGGNGTANMVRQAQQRDIPVIQFPGRNQGA